MPATFTVRNTKRNIVGEGLTYDEACKLALGKRYATTNTCTAYKPGETRWINRGNGHYTITRSAS